MIRKVSLRRDDLLTDIADAAYLVADVEEGKETPHRLHQTFDICEEENLPHANRLLDLAFTEARCLLLPILEGGRGGRPGKHLTLHLILPAAGGFILESRVREAVREFIVSRVLNQWLSVTLPASAEAWRRRGDELASSLKDICATANRENFPVAFSRRCSPF